MPAPRAKRTHPNEELHRMELATSINQVIDGKIEPISTVTLTSASATTVVNVSQAGQDSVPILVPLDANAAAEVGNGTIYISTRADGSFTITHANNANTRLFAFAILG